MKTKAIALFLLGFIPAFAQDIPTSKTEQNMDRIERCKKNYTELFGGEALTGQGTDPEIPSTKSLSNKASLCLWRDKLPLRKKIATRKDKPYKAGFTARESKRP